MMDTDAVLVEIGEFGKFQLINYLLICLPVLFSAGNSLTYVFTAGVPNYRCYVPGCDNETTDYTEWFVEDAIPPKTPTSQYYTPSLCEMYTIDVYNNTANNNNNDVHTCLADYFTDQVQTCDRWVYEENEHTIVAEYDITCAENQWKLSLVGTIHFVGILFGTAIFGYLADRYGRKRVFIFCIVLMSLTGIAQALAPDYVTFQVFVFLNALGTSGVFPLAFILGVELVGKSKREMSGVILNYFYAVGEALVGIIAWATKNWIHLQLILSTPPVIFVIYYWFIPESVRWLVANKQFKEAGRIFKRAAKVNGVQLSQQLVDSFDGDQTESTSSEEEKVSDKIKPGGEEKSTTRMWAAFKKIIFSKRLLYRSLLLFYIWAANAFVYYGLSVNSTSLGGSKYLNFILVCLVEIPGYTISWWMMNHWGRRWSVAVSLFLCAVTCLGAAFVPEDITGAVVALFLIGKLGITSSFGVIYVYTAELYPTIVRSVGVGVSSTMARFGAIIAPFAPLLGAYSKPLPLLLFGIVAAIAGFVVLLLPETLGTKLPDTVEEAENLKLVKESPTSSESYSYNENA